MKSLLRILALLALTVSVFGAPTETVPAGKKATLSAQYEGDPATVEWFKDSIKAGDGPQIVIASFAATDAGTYRARVTNPAGRAEAELQLVLGDSPGVRSVTIASSYAGEVIPTGTPLALTATATNFTSPTFQWVRDDIYIPATAATYAIASVTSGDAGIYSVIAGDATGFERSNTIAVIVSAPPPPIALPPAITSAPVSITVPKKGTARFTVGATGERISYQWAKRLTPIPGATSATLTIASIKPPDAGEYIVTVSNAAGYVKAGASLFVR